MKTTTENTIHWHKNKLMGEWESTKGEKQPYIKYKWLTFILKGLVFLEGKYWTPFI